MSITSKPVDLLTEADIQALIDNRVPESKKLDYKEVFSLDSEDKKREFLKDVSAFYNTEGGVLIYGLAEEKDGKTKLGIPRLPEKENHVMKGY